MRVADLQAIRIKLASPEEILAWSHGEVTKPETINYRTQKPEKEGLFDEKIFGPEKDYECYCGKYRGIRHKGIVCDKCGVEVTKAQVRRERMGHIKLASPVSHIWFLRGVPSRMGQVLDLPMSQLEKVIYFNAYIITKVDEETKKKILEQIDKEYQSKLKIQKSRLLRQSADSGGQAKAESAKGKKQDKDKRDAEKVLAKEKKGAEHDLKRARDAARDEVSNLKVLKIISEIDYFDLSLKYGHCFEAGSGAESLRKIFGGVDLKKQVSRLRQELETASPLNKRKVLKRIKLLQGMEKAHIRPEWMFLTVLPVLPPDLRPMVQLDGGRYASSDLNDLYRRVINRNNRLKYLLEIGAPEVIVRNEKRMLQEAVDALIDNGMRKGTMTQATTGGRRLLKSLADILKGKQGRFRQNLLGKRVDYSGRSVIVVGPELLLHQVGLPKKMALELFKPFVIKKVLDKELAYNVRGASRLIDQETDDIWAILEEVVKDKLVLLNRAPTLHRLGIQAFYPILIEGEAIRIHPLVCRAFNADFDGDQMAVHLPLSEEAQKEAREIMLSSLNLLKPATGLPIVSPTQDIVLGCYWFTKLRAGAKGEGKIFGSPDEALLAHEFGELDLQAQIKVPSLLVKGDKKPAKGDRKNAADFIETSAGRLIFNQALPEDFPFQNQEMNSKRLEELIREVIEKYGISKTQPILDKIKTTGFDGATRSGISWGMDDLKVPAEKPKLIEAAEKEIAALDSHYQKGFLSREEKYQRSIEVWQRAKSEIEKLVPKALPDQGSVFTIIDSGARGSWAQPVQMAGMKGLVINPVGRIIELPIKHSYKEGFDVLEYFLSTHGARKGTADTALRTSTAGYLTRRLVDVNHEVIVKDDDCGDDNGILLLRREADEISQNFLMKIIGRVALEDIGSMVKKGEIIDWEKGKEIVRVGIDQVRARSPLSCKLLKGVCRKCYGWDFGKGKMVEIGEAVGVVAAQAIGEPGTQLTMKTFHMGGVASGGDITMGLPRVEEIFETRVPVGKGVISQASGSVTDIVDQMIITVKPEGDDLKKAKAKKQETLEYQIPKGRGILVKVGDKVLPGQPLCEGNLDLKELFKIVGQDQTQNHIIREVQRIYASQGAAIHDKHLEVVVRQMFSRLKIKDSGDSDFIQGEIVSKTKFSGENKRLKKEGKKPAVSLPVLLGISKVALATDSFLSAASFIETSRVLIRAAIEGKEDCLEGLKENVIIGKLIPAGTGYKK
ncbi:MAG: DNA-directed RNA polymerase subunit beta' [bacterium]|nr:DNA-directed RNA polymerase subunit beta' [bacterium]